MEDQEHQLYFNKDTANKYEFDEYSLPNGGIYGLGELRDINDGNKRITAKILVVIETVADFENNVRTTAVKFVKEEGGEAELGRLMGILSICTLF